MMGPQATEAYKRFQYLQLPLKNLMQRNSAKGIADALGDALPACDTRYQKGSEKGWDGQIHIETFSLGSMTCICAKTTPMLAVKEESNMITAVLQFAGCTEYKEGREREAAQQGSILLHRNKNGLISVNGGCAITFELDPARLGRTRRAMGGSKAKDINDNLIEKIENTNSTNASKWFGLFSYIDSLMGEDQRFPSAMGLDEQIYRLMSLHQLQAIGEWRDSSWNDRHVKPGEAIISKLEDYIERNCHLGLSLTDLEEQSHYSGRQLHNIFMEIHECSPMQYVRRKRMQTALARVESAKPIDTIESIAREMGYRQVSHFSSDFKRYFGYSPSVILRSVRGQWKT